MVRLGCEVLEDASPAWLRHARLGLLSNQASVNGSFEHVLGIMQRLGGKVRYLFSPQHGFFAEKQANMQESCDDWHSPLEIPIISLYSNVRQPSLEVLQEIDVLVIDLQDVGTRVYTYTTTMGLCMEAAGKAGVKVVVLDRPNPINGLHIEGNLLNRDYRSFVGWYPVPMRHGLTMGEFARYVAQHCGVTCELEVIPMRGWERGALFPETGLPWVFPSPNMPTWETSLLYPGMVLLEGTNVSEGRGTTLPFLVFGAPFLDQRKLASCLRQYDLEGMLLRPISFVPVFDKWQGQTCHGFQIHVTDVAKFRPYRLGLAIIQGLCHVHEGQFQWLEPPYEYEYEKLPIDIILGDGAVRARLESGVKPAEMEAGWETAIESYRKERTDYLLYR